MLGMEWDSGGPYFYNGWLEWQGSSTLRMLACEVVNLLIHMFFLYCWVNMASTLAQDGCFHGLIRNKYEQKQSNVATLKILHDPIHG